MNPGVPQVLQTVSTRPVDDDAAESRLHSEVLPVLRAMREAINLLCGELASVTTSGTLNPNISFLLVDATAGPVTVTLPLANEVMRPVIVMKTDASGNAVTIQGQSPSTVNGGTIALAAQNDGRLIMSDLFNFWSPVL